ncbi:hypothetical protein AVEN_177381-1 [Araneus ventricosus]|uniref:Uncharacterized protein n=1 Tax=Araneus ventricosus TaxID=182803 RepID=A0A4Y2WM64_ARAVE|nr:hypothetical protein AVEN_177381-1 [Araneus ventricosus]
MTRTTSEPAVLSPGFHTTWSAFHLRRKRTPPPHTHSSGFQPGTLRLRSRRHYHRTIAAPQKNSIGGCVYERAAVIEGVDLLTLLICDFF